MINEDTPYKLAEIIRDTWPNLFRPANRKTSWECTTQSTVTETLVQDSTGENYKPKV
jgi:hypothetical protein